MKYVILIHLLEWEFDDNEYILDDGINLVNLNHHPIGNLYEKMCEEENIDDGEPFTFDTGIILYDDSGEDHSFLPSASHYSLSTTLINLLTIIYKGTLGHCRIIISKDDFKSSLGSYILYDDLTEFTHNLAVYKSKVDEKHLKILSSTWTNLKLTYISETKTSRIDNVLRFFYSSWHTLSFELAGISLSVVLETLFSPHSNSELTHQIAYNVANFVGKDKEDKMKLYKYVKKYYSIRSKLVHGEVVKENELKSIPEFFKFMCDIILKIISDENLIDVFNDNKKRRDFIEDKLFH